MPRVSRTLVRAGLVSVVVAGLAAGPAAVALAHSRSAPTRHQTPALTSHGGVSGHPKKPVPVPVAPHLGDGVPGRDLGWWPYGNLVHGAFVVESKKHALVPVVVQRGTVTALGDHSVTVTSADKVVMTWTTTANTREVSKPKGRSRTLALAVGASVGIWGSGTTDAATAAVILIRTPAKPAPTPTPSASPTPTATPSATPTPTPTDTPTPTPTS